MVHNVFGSFGALFSLLSLSAVFSFGPVSAKAACTDEKTALEMSLEQLERIDPCNAVVEMFRGGFATSAIPKRPHSSKDIEKYKYYPMIRLYLQRKENPHSADFSIEFRYLISASLFVSAENSRRQAAYAAYIMNEYWSDLGEVRGDGAAWMEMSLQEAFIATGFPDIASLYCFIKYDMPSLDFETITGSNAFRSCVKP
ncbi:hypothetical protein [Pacificoceanicola onchidii]|uniref:hypothetical protein n=1 Tax=Pacificoceanicola onchidii TaxID=2562685 RepID=UPI0014560907|nr:hypothetical protein [Pacificoceanicola onchidii]